MGALTAGAKDLKAQLVNDVLLEVEGRPKSTTTPVGMIVTRNGKLRDNGHPVTVKYFVNEFYTKIEIWLEGHTGFAMEIFSSDFDDLTLRTYAVDAYNVAVGRITGKEASLIRE